jgi:GTP-binding protein HflX
LILHVRDVAHPDSAAQRGDVLAVLNGMVKDGTLDESWQGRTIEVLNKADLLGGIGSVPLRDDSGIAVSALTGDGLPALLSAIDRFLASQLVTASYDVPVEDGAKLAWLYRHGEVLEREDGDTNVHVQVRMSDADRARFEKL